MAAVDSGGRPTAVAALSMWRGRVVRARQWLSGAPVLALVTVGGAALLAESMHLIFQAT